MREPIERSADTVNLRPFGLLGAIDHYDRQAKRSCGSDLGVGACSTGVLRDDQIYIMRQHEVPVVFLVERSPIHNHLGPMKGQRFLRRIHKPKNVKVLRVRRELHEMHSAHRQHDVLGRLVQRLNRSRNIFDASPIVTGQRFPLRPGQRQKRNARYRTGGDCISAHLDRKRMGCIDDMRYVRGLNKACETIGASETTNPLGQGLPKRALNATGKRDCAGQTLFVSRPCKRCCFCRSRKDQQVVRHG